ncbi:hypothetical protein UY3_00736 [Chelonia mydas]|uniref:RBR-type E3 ubiquitin transferase n=1 Tax=Chelonia mydas TaxID=8469 RepID=M7C1H7_CHEMY|nr:hypothetical protein UY3_00736 [Chelonia mydas]
MTTARYRPTWDLVLDPLVSCKLCLGEYPVEQMTTIAQCQCIFCTLCLKQYVELLIKEGLETAISCPDASCPKRGHLQENEIECMVASEIMQRYKKLQFEREVLLDPCRTWCPSSACQAVCQLQESGPQNPQLVQCKACDIEFCSSCKSNWHPGQGCQENIPITFLPGETSSMYKMEDDDAPIKRCPKCKVYIERDEGCAQMMCKNCKHAFCWYCLESLDSRAQQPIPKLMGPNYKCWAGVRWVKKQPNPLRLRLGRVTSDFLLPVGSVRQQHALLLLATANLLQCVRCGVSAPVRCSASRSTEHPVEQGAAAGRSGAHSSRTDPTDRRQQQR